MPFGKSFNVVFNNDNLEEKKNLIIAKQKKSEKFDLRDGPGRCIGYIISKLGYEGESSITNGNINYYKKNKDEYNLLTELELRVKNKNLCAAGQPLRQCLIDFSEYEKELYIEFVTGKKIYHKVKNKPAERSLTELGCSDFDYLKFL